ncbi:conserved hypothetical protein [Hyella patelloides LEGE 07179]|uniref:Twin-arginine translocation pathway signal n=1 Tax=Hyella patelloides LEGE 07179 TaxID=945734 RepID=A0A563VIW7_9CYAN|nr:DUF1501 domain-containing protein [Hyella patelloides]VEP11352.1 conserved hypothetical protein [Hyella patelloides LEGE 07179]
MKRRKFLQTVGLATGGMILPVGSNNWVARGVDRANNPQRLVVILLRGAIDGLNVVIPHQDADYYSRRPSIAINPPGETKGAIDLDGFFGLHPALSDLIPFWQQKNLAFITNCGSPEANRSHFDAQDYLETGTPGIKQTPDGWLNRLLAQLPQDNPTQALNVGNTTPKILKGTMPIAHLRPGKNSLSPLPLDRPRVSNAFDRLYSGNSKIDKAYQEGRQARSIILEQLNQEMMSASRGAISPHKFVDDAAEVAQLIAGDAKTQLAFMDIGGWDTHINEPGVLNRSLPPLGEGLATLVNNLGAAYKDTVILVMSEFGRTVQENGNKGTDHGHGNLMWLLGGAVKGGKIYGDWTGLSESNLYEGRDLPVTTDFREAIASILTQHLNLSLQQLASVFPNYQLVDNLNLLKG